MKRASTAMMVITVASATIAAICVPCYSRGRRIDPELRFFVPYRPLSVDEASVVYPIEYALHSNEANDVVFIGDSTCCDGVDPARLERTGIRSYNLGSLGGLGPVPYAITLRAYFEHHPRPKLVVLCLSPFTLGTPAAWDQGKRFIANYGPETDRGFVEACQAMAYFVRRGATWSASQRDRRGDPLRDYEHETYWSLKPKVLARRGFHPLPEEHSQKRREPPKEHFMVWPNWEKGVPDICRTCGEFNVPLLIRFMPVAEHLRSERDFDELLK
jgi:hypothetical protein